MGDTKHCESCGQEVARQDAKDNWDEKWPAKRQAAARALAERDQHRLATWEQLRDALRLLWAWLPESTANAMFADDLAQIDAALAAAKE